MVQTEARFVKRVFRKEHFVHTELHIQFHRENAASDGKSWTYSRTCNHPGPGAIGQY